MAFSWCFGLAVVVLLSLSTSSNAENPFMPIFLKEQESRRWSSLLEKAGQPEIQITHLLHSILTVLKSSSFPTAVANISNQKCVEDSLLYVHTLYSLGPNTTWARQMHESSGELPLGMSGSGNLHADGLFDECLAIRGPKEAGFKGKYCTVFLSTTTVDPSEVLPISPMDGKANIVTIFQLINQILGGMIIQAGRVEPKTSEAEDYTYLLPSVSLCLPSSCSADDLGQSVAQLVGTFIIGGDPLTSILTTTDEEYCFTDDSVRLSFDGPDIAVLVTLCLLGLLVVAGTIHECWQMYRSTSNGIQRASKVLRCFSALNNGRKILSMKVAQSAENIGCLHGIRVISTMWVVLGHTWLNVFSNVHNMNAAMEDAKAWWFQAVNSSTISVDTFFLMSGLLVSYLLLKELERNKGRFNLGLFYINRYLRITPVYAVVLGFVATLIVYVGNGPNWFSVTATSADCRSNWWRHFLYINNFFDHSSLCMQHSWYLDVDMQLFLIAPMFVYFLWRWVNLGLIVLISATLASLGVSVLVYVLFDLPPTLLFVRLQDFINSSEFYDYYYFLPWTRAAPYLVGILLGWFLHVTKESNRKVSKAIILLGWITSLAVGFAIVYGLTPYLDEEKVPTIDPAIRFTYGPLHRTAWALAVGWVVWACVRGYGGFANRFLSWKGFMPLSRLTFCVYLVHFDYLHVFYSVNRKLLYYTFFSQLTTYMGFLMSVFGLAFIVSLAVEAPFINLTKLLFAGGKSGAKKKEDIKTITTAVKNETVHENGVKSSPPEC